MRYRRATIGGATYFFTVNLAEQSSRLLIDRVDDLREGVREVHEAHPFDIVAWVVRPDHLHAVWQLPQSDADYSLRCGLIKFNPVKRGDVGRASDWAVSSIHRYVRLGWVDGQWGCMDDVPTVGVSIHRRVSLTEVGDLLRSRPCWQRVLWSGPRSGSSKASRKADAKVWRKAGWRAGLRAGWRANPRCWSDN